MKNAPRLRRNLAGICPVVRIARVRSQFKRDLGNSQKNKEEGLRDTGDPSSLCEFSFGRIEWLELVTQGELHYAGVG
jgi:hypothetical protein